MFGQIIVYDQHIFSLIHKMLCHCCSCIRRNILKRRTVTCCGRYHDRIIQCIIVLQCIYDFCNSRSLLSNRHINTDQIFSLLIQDCIQGNGCLSCLTISDDQLSLSASDREHRINRKDSCLHRHTDRFSVNDSRRLLLDRAVIICFDLTLSVDRSPQCIDNSSYIFISNRYTGLFSCTSYFCSFFDICVPSKKNDSDFIFLNILYHSFQTRIEGNNLSIHCVINPINSRNSVTYSNDCSHFAVFAHTVKIFYLFF